MHANRLQFLEFTFDARTGELSKPEGKVRLQPQPTAALRVLLGRAGELVTRDELKIAIWPDTTVEADQGLNFCIRQIRIALGDDAEGGRFIETLPRRGYRFLPEVRDADAIVIAAESVPAIAGGANGEITPARSVISGRALFVLAALALAAVWLYRSRSAAESAQARIGVAILPLASSEAAIGDTSAFESMNASITEALVSSLTGLSSPQLGVRGPATSAPYATSNLSHIEIGQRMQVEYVVSGGVRTRDTTLFVQVVRVRDGDHVFAWRQPVGQRSASVLSTIVAQGIAERIAADTHR